MANANTILYTGLRLNHLNINPNTLLDVALGLIDTAFGSGGPVPDYSGFNLRCVTQVDGVTHPTNTQNFAEGISKVLCDFETAYTTFTGTTYVTDQGVITTAINALQVPGLTYAAFSITNTDTNTQVWNKAFTGFTGIINSIKPDSSNWTTIGASTATSIVSAFNTIIAYEVTQDTLISGKQASLGTFNLSPIGGSSGQTPTTAISSLITYAATLPTYATGSVTWGCVTQGGSLTTDINSIVVKVNALTANYIADGTTGLTKTNIGSCLGYRLAVDPTWVGLFKVAVNGTDAAADTGDYLVNKFTSTDTTVVITDTGTHLDLSVPASASINKVKVNSSGTADYLINKLPATVGDWGLAIVPTIVSDQIKLVPTIDNPTLFIQNMMTEISTSPELLSQFCALISQCATEFSVTVITV